MIPELSDDVPHMRLIGCSSCIVTGMLSHKQTFHPINYAEKSIVKSKRNKTSQSDYRALMACSTIKVVEVLKRLSAFRRLLYLVLVWHG